MADDARSWKVERATLLIVFLLAWILFLTTSGSPWVRLLLGLDLIGIGTVTLVDRDGTMQLFELSLKRSGITTAPPVTWGIAVASAVVLIVVGVLVMVSAVTP